MNIGVLNITEQQQPKILSTAAVITFYGRVPKDSLAVFKEKRSTSNTL